MINDVIVRLIYVLLGQTIGKRKWMRFGGQGGCRIIGTVLINIESVRAVFLPYPVQFVLANPGKQKGRTGQ